MSKTKHKKEEKKQNKKDIAERKLYKIAKKVFVKEDNEKKRLEEYLKYRKDISELEKTIQALKESDNFSEKKRKEIAAYKSTKESIEASMITLEEGFYNEAKGMWIGLAVDLEDVDSDIILLYLDWKKLHNHFVVYGTSGYGKSRLFAIIMRQIIKFGWNVFAIDPKGGDSQEIARWMYEFALNEGRQDSVMRIIVSYPDLSDRMNPIFGMGDEEIATLCKSFSSTGVGAESASEKYFSGQMYRITYAILKSMRFLEKLTYYGREEELTNEIIKEAQKYMKFKDSANNDIEYEDEDITIPDIAKITLDQVLKKNVSSIDISPFNRTLVTFKELAFFGQFEQLEDLLKLVETYPIPSTKDKKDLAEMEYLKAEAMGVIKPLVAIGADKYNAVGDTFSVFMGQLAFGSIGKILTSTRINPLRLKLRKDSVLALLEPAPLRFEAVSEMLVKVFVRMFISIFGEIGASGRLMEKRVAFLVDEAKPMVFPGIEELYNKARSLGMTIGAFYQSTSDIKIKLGETLADIVSDSTATKFYMKQESPISQEEAAGSLGTVKVPINIHMASVDGGVGKSTVTYEDRTIAKPDHIDALQIGEAFVRHYGKKYFVKFPYQSDPAGDINIVMPELESESIYNELSKINGFLKDKMEIMEEKKATEDLEKIA